MNYYVINKYMKGGKAIASGSYGCVFKPAMLCKGDAERKKDYITKVMYHSYADLELKEMKMVTDVLKDIPDGDKYFLANNITRCQLNELVGDDVKGRKNKCSGAFGKSLTDREFNLKINKGLITGINIPYGGKDLLDTIGPNLTSKAFMNINKGIINLIKNGIVKFNKKKLLHLDIKHMNMLYNPKDKNVRLIDWGICAKYTNDVVTEGVKDRNLMFNRPIVNFLFDHHFTSVLKDVLVGIPDLAILTKTQLKDALTFIFRSFLEPNFKGLKPKPLRAPAPQTFILNIPHYFIIADFFKAAFENKLIREAYPDLSAMSEAEFMSRIIRDSLIPVMVEFLDLKTGIIDTKRLFNTSYKFNVDIYGALTSYMIFISKFNDKLVTFKKMENAEKLQLHIFKIAMKYMFNKDVGLKPYNVPELLNELQNLDRVLSGEPLKKKSSKVASPVKPVASPVKPVASPVKPVASPVKPATKTIKVKRTRCPKGTFRNKATGDCESRSLKKSEAVKKETPVKPKKRTRCPNGQKRDKKTGDCVPK